MKELTEKTLIPIGLALTAIGGGSAFVTKIYLMTDANAAALQQTEKKVEELNELNKTILEKLTRIEERVNFLASKKGEQWKD